MHKHVVWLIILLASASDSPAQFPFPGATFEDRKRAYIEDQGARWAGDFPSAMRMPLFAWLEQPNVGNNRSRISEEIGYLTRDDCPDDFSAYNNCWFVGAEPGPLVAGRVYYQYYQNKKIISDADAQKIKPKLLGVARSPGVWCSNANFHFTYLVTAYLYVSRVEHLGSSVYPKPDAEYHCPEPFTYNGRSYTGGNSYDSKTIYSDYLSQHLDIWLQQGSEEDLSPSGYYAMLVAAINLLYDFSPDPVIKNKAKMLLDWMVLQHAIGFSANHISGGHGRHYRYFECGGQDSFPFGIFYNISPDPVTRWNVFTDFYVTSYRQPQVLVDLVEMKGEGDDYYRLIRGDVPALSGAPWFTSVAQSCRYDYVTKNYNLGGAYLGTGWELNIKSADSPFKVFINWQEPPPDVCNWSSADNQAFALGTYGYQHRNAVFVDGGGYLYEWLKRDVWDEKSSESGWRFFRKNKVAVAIKMANTCALEVCTIGVDYPGYDDFKTAMKTQAELTGDYFKTSQGVKISKGYIDYGADFTGLPFDRLEVWEGHVGRNDETKIIDWQNNVMTISKHGKKIIHDFNKWVYSEDGSYNIPDYQPPAPPRNFKVTQ